MKLALRRYLTNPIIIRELKTVLRKKGSFGSLLLLALISTGIVSSIWVSVAAVGGSFGMLSEVSRGLFVGISYVIFFLSTLIVLTITASAITLERENKTFDLLVSTGLGKAHVLLGKLISALGFIFFLIFASLPLISICFLMGGVSFMEVFMSYGAIFTTLAAIGMIGIMCSSFCKTSKRAMSLTSLIIILLYLVAPIGIEVLKEFVGSDGFRNGNIFIALNPYINFSRIFFGGQIMPFKPQSFLAKFSPLVLTVASNLVVFLISYLIALKHYISPEREKTKVRKKYIDDQEMLHRRRTKFPYYIIDPLKKNREIQDTENPAYVKEKRYTFSSKMAFIIRFGYMAMIIGAILAALLFFHGFMEGIATYCFIAILIGSLFILSLSSGSVVEEVERETFDLLRSTLITPTQVYFAKIKFLLKTSLIVMTLYFIPGIAISHFGFEESGLQFWMAWIISIYSVVMAMVLCCAIGLLFSMIKTARRNTLSGSIAAFVLISLVPIGIMSVGMAISFYLDRNPEQEFWESVAHFFAGFLSPVHFLVYTFEKLGRRISDIPWWYITRSVVSFVIFMALIYRLIYLRFRYLWFYGFRTTSIFKEFFKKVREIVWAS